VGGTQRRGGLPGGDKNVNRRGTAPLGRAGPLDGTERIFRRLRNLVGSLEISISVLVTAEIVAKVYYPALYAATNSAVLRAICQQLYRDEAVHVVFQTEQLAKIRASRSALGIWVTAILHRILFCPTAVLIALSHGAVIRRSGLRRLSFLWRCRREFLADLAAMFPRDRIAQQDAAESDSRRDWNALASHRRS
jgi:hypothetical protein